MARRRKQESIIGKPRDSGLALTHVVTVTNACPRIGASGQSY